MGNNFNGSTVLVVEDFIGNLIEAPFNVALIRDNESESLPKNLQERNHNFEILSVGRFDVAGIKLRYMHVNELMRPGQENSLG